jgi:hypothetical protein
MDTLTIDKALELHRIIGKHIPELDENEDALQFIGKIVNSIQDSNSHRVLMQLCLWMAEIGMK